AAAAAAAGAAAAAARAAAAAAAAPAGSAPDFSIILPTFNERDNVPVLLWLLLGALDPLAVTFEAVFVDDASPDGTADAVRALQAAFGSHLVRLVSRPRKLGLGSAYAAGLAASRGRFIVLMDADLSHHPRHLPAFIAAQRATGADIVAGTRYAAGGGVAGWSLRRKLTSRGANLLASFVLGATASDLTGAYRLYKRDALACLLGRCTSRGYAFQMEVIVRAQYGGFRIAEVPIVFVDRLYGASKLGAGEYVQFVRGLLGLLVSL
ncbi:Dolichol-phosphate mannosyltransferase, partial [Tetrabaena socialis]